MSLQLTYNITNYNFTLILPISGGIVLSVDWGDGNIDSLKTHTYLNSGIYNISILGEDITDLNSLKGSGIEYLTECNSFGEIGLINLSYAFFNAVNLIIVPNILP